MENNIVTTKKVTALTLIREFFKSADQSIAQFAIEYRALTETDKIELASAIARQKGISESITLPSTKGLDIVQLAFLPVNY